jgi:hypothetical protein
LIPLGILFSAQMKSSLFCEWTEVRHAIGRCSRHEKLPDYEDMLSIAERSGAKPDAAPPLTAVERMNVALVVVTYVVIIYGPLTVGSFALFFAIAHVAVPHAVAAEWVFGDGTAPALGVELIDASLLRSAMDEGRVVPRGLLTAVPHRDRRHEPGQAG